MNKTAAQDEIKKYRDEGIAITDRLNALEPGNSAIRFLNTDSSISRLYSLNVPFQITYEYCSGDADDDYLNILTLHEGGSLFYKESVGHHNKYDFAHVSPHHHDYYEFMIVLDSSVMQQIEGNNYLYPTGTCCLINRNLSHKEYYYSKATVLYLGFSVDFLVKLFESAQASHIDCEKEIIKTDLYRFIRDDLQRPGRGAYLDFIPLFRNEEGTKKLKDLTEEVMKQFLFPSFGSSFLIPGLLCQILHYISSPDAYHCTVAEIRKTNDYLIFARTRHLLEENNGRLTRQDISSKLNYSGDYINRIINKYTGMSLHAYSMTFSLKKAAELLVTTDTSISEIAISLGFSNRTYFYNLFKEKYDLTPREYRLQKKTKPGH